MSRMYSSFSRATNYKSNKINGMSPLDRKVKRNPKYSNVRSALDTGASMSKVDIITTRAYLARKSELFKRVSAPTVAELMDEHLEDPRESIFDIGAGAEHEDADSSNTSGIPLAAPGSPSAGEPRVAVADPDDYSAGFYVQDNKPPFIVLDVREKHEFSQCRIACARHFPANDLKHDKITPELFYYKNRAQHVIVIYDLDDRMAREVATMFTEKGWENVFLLSGGLETFAHHFREKVKGELPAPAQEEQPVRSRGGKSGGGRPPIGPKIGQALDQKRGRPPLNPRRGGSHLTTENVMANDRATRTPGKGRMGSANRAPSVGNASTMSRAESLLSWNGGKTSGSRTSMF